MNHAVQARVVRSLAMPAGVYFLGDPVHAMDCDDYDEVLETSKDFQRPRIKHGDSKVLAFRTAAGRRVLNDDTGEGYRVESGLIGLVPAHLVGRPAPALKKVGRLVQFDQPVRCSYMSDGTFTFGEIRIVTPA